MAIHIVNNEDSQAAKFAILTAAPGHGSGYYPDYQRFISSSDPLIRLGSTLKWMLPFRADTYGNILGDRASRSGERRLTISHKPTAVAYPWLYDDITYGNIYLKGYQQAMNVLSGGKFQLPSTTREKHVRHATYSGTLSPKLSDGVWDNVTVSHMGALVATRMLRGYVKKMYQVDHLQPFLVSMIGTDYELYDYLAFLDSISTGSHVFTGPMWYTWDYHPAVVSGLSYELGPNTLVVTYHVKTTASSGNTWTNDWDSRLEVNLTPDLPDVTDYYVGDQTSAPINVSYVWKHTNHVRYAMGNVYPYVSYPDFEVTGSSTAYVIPIAHQVFWHYDDYGSLKSTSGIYQLNSADALFRFKRLVDADWKHIVPSSTFSANDSFDQLRSTLGVNALETLNELPEIVGVLPNLKLATKIIKNIAGKKHPIETCRDMITFATGTHLQSAFVWRPYGELIQKYLPVLESRLRTMFLTKHLTLGYGKFSHVFATGTYDRPLARLTTRTKMVLDVSPSGLTSGILTMDELGLTPRFSSVWETYPLTFVLDWWTKLGDLLYRLENATVMWPLPAIYVHSYKVTSPFTEDELDTWQLSNTEEELAGLRLFYRDVSRYSPVPRPSRHNFGIPKEVPFVALSGSLLWTLLFGGSS